MGGHVKWKGVSQGDFMEQFSNYVLTFCLQSPTDYWLLVMQTPYVLHDYSCGQTKSSNLLTDFLRLRKASELVDNGINEFLLISLINSNGKNFQKWRYKGFYTPKIWPVPEKIAKNTKNIPIDSFLFPLFDLNKIFPKYWSEINQKSVFNSGNFAGTVMWSYPFQVKVSRKQI